MREELAQGYNFSRGRLKPVKYMEIVVRGAGSVFSSVEDMGRYAAALLGGGANEHGRVLEPETLSLMVEPHYQLDERLPAMGFAFHLDDLDGHRIAGTTVAGRGSSRPCCSAPKRSWRSRGFR